jgi:hypothetical protein
MRFHCCTANRSDSRYSLLQCSRKELHGMLYSVAGWPRGLLLEGSDIGTHLHNLALFPYPSLSPPRLMHCNSTRVESLFVSSPSQQSKKSKSTTCMQVKTRQYLAYNPGSALDNSACPSGNPSSTSTATESSPYNPRSWTRRRHDLCSLEQPVPYHQTLTPILSW